MELPLCTNESAGYLMELSVKGGFRMLGFQNVVFPTKTEIIAC